MKQAAVIGLACLLVLAVSACAARSQVRPQKGNSVAAASHNEPVCFIQGPLPSSIEYQVIGQILGSKRWYGSSSEVLSVMANEARRVGADVVMKLVTGTDVNVIAWARPVGEGTAVKLKDKDSFDCKYYDGRFF